MPNLAWSVLPSGAGTLVPKEPATGLYTGGFVHGPGLPRMPWMVVSNGAIQKSSASKTILGKATIPCIPFISTRGAEGSVEYVFHERCKAFVRDLRKHLKIKGSPRIWGESIEDIKSGAMKRIGRDEVQLFATTRDLCFGWEDDYMTDSLLRIQQELTLFTATMRAYPVMRPVGYGFIRRADGGYELKARPSNIIDYASGEARVRMSPIEDKVGPRELRDQAAYLYPTAYAFMDWAGEALPFYTIHDWACGINTLAGNYKAYGDISIARKYSASDITSVITSVIGTGVSAANPVLPLWDDQVRWAKYIRAMTMFGFFLARTMGTTAEVDFYKFKGSPLIAEDRWDMALAPNIEAWGSNTTPYHIMPYNRLEDELPVPMLVDMTENTMNVYKRNTKYTRTFSTLTIDRGEAPELDATTESTTHVRPIIKCDARVRKRRELYRELTIVELPRWNTFVNGDPGASRHGSLYFWLFYNKQNSLKHGYVTAFAPWANNVDTMSTEMDAMWEQAIKGMEERAVAGAAPNAQYTKDSKQIKAPPQAEERTSTSDMTAIPVEVRRALEHTKGKEPVPLAKLTPENKEAEAPQT
jgi:hypothetical protein